MTRLRLQFILFFILLAGSLGFFVWNSYRQLGREERELWRGQAEKVYNQMQAAVSDFLTAEDGRRWSDYRFWGTLTPDKYPKQLVGFSPLSRLPQDDARGLIGYFQIDPDGEFSTPYLPEGWPTGMDSLIHRPQGRREIFQKLQDMTSSLRAGKEPKGAMFRVPGYVELGDLKKSLAGAMDDFDRGNVQKDVRDVAEAELAQGVGKASVARSKNVYPNPIQEQAVQLEKRKMSSAKVALAPKKEEAPPPAPASPPAVSASAPAQEGYAGAATSKPAEPERRPEVTLPQSVLADPFQARLVDEQYLLFYRKVWVDHRQYLQGFAVDLEKFYSWLMDQSFANSELPEFALARLELGDRTLAQYGIVDLALYGLPPFFKRSLGYPLNLFDWGVYASVLPRIGTRWFLNALSAAVVLLATIGLYLIYRTAASQVAYSQKRQDFVSAVTHELKTPLTSIRMYAEMLEDGWAKDEDKISEYYRQISKESGRLSRLIENVLQLARLEKKTYKLNLKKDVPTADFKELCGELKGIAERPGFALSWKADEDLPPLLYDPEAIKQIFLSLLDNSLKFGSGSADKSLEASLERKGDRVVWLWRDRGPGIPDKELSRVFENFYRVENEMTRKTQGTGIGLAMSRMLAHAMGAEIRARNREGGGLEVVLEFPAA
ncbi:MAG TPA: HAMP domain-containing sensor histidine kinase [bacterium]|nr:HAMP domain-containing sensor histidine kinase [bacterium]